ncbi:Probable HTH-type transcriptional regulator ygaV [Budvicia aquatica]|uniref:Probable HTH-type transcriptional regulator ygaV n=1 Tax=Budvicia aquatica TaxID=82979 RepID=A0A484ZIH6_9GAMM|nr:hypothetical protein [Budvicia aquatica]VFS47223.1 Probable HTH-type transcriptional regulator ygaV [Budvicia aquatica]
MKETKLFQLQEGASLATTLLKSMSNSSRLLILCILIDKPGTSSGELGATDRFNAFCNLSTPCENERRWFD